MESSIRPSATVWENLSPARIIAISTTLTVHILAFGLLLAPVAMPERVPVNQTVTEIMFTEPEKPKPIPLLPVPPKPLAPVTAAPARPSVAPVPKADNVVATTDQALPGDVYVPEQAPEQGENIGNMAGGEVDASTRAQYPIAYPPAALRGGITGMVIVLASYDAAGTVTATRIYQGSRDKTLDRAALAGVRKWKINPRRVQGQPVGGEALVEVRFNL
ncbi:energy transducer TonB [Arenimonas sp. GDDSR-1]|uniref:energy transducer TonB n=1 Tax=Arenimonas sp. GDDSR-1 TaxID=2950125 RepID=UPI002619EDE1|nr:energy transducer TonB [Arenimonas sp. GDDSR-1]